MGTELLTEEQKIVVEATGSRLTVTASAGAGKTRVLVAKYLDRVAMGGIAPDRILTITFTRKAAAEMKKRIVDGLRELGLTDAAQIAETGPIQTIHSFCERLLRENALEAAMDPEFEILSEAQSVGLAAGAIRDALGSSIEEMPLAELLISTLAGARRFFGGGSGPYGEIESAIGDVLSGLRGTGLTVEELGAQHIDPDELLARWRNTILRAQPSEIQEAFAGIDEPSFQRRLSSAWKKSTQSVPAWLRPSVDETEERLAASDACGLVQLSCEAWWRLEAAMDQQQRLDFSALEARAVRLIEGSEAVRQKMSHQFEVVMVDEAQDLNPMQYRLLNALRIPSELIVGDAQQSIYGFRQADLRQFESRAGEGSLKLKSNHRSEAGILNYVNEVFSSLWGEAYEDMKPPATEEDAEKIPQSLFAEPDFSGVEVWEHPAFDPTLTANYVAQLINEGEPLRDIAILTRGNGPAYQLKVSLDKLGIDSRITGGAERFYTRMEVRDLSNTLKSVANPYDDFALLCCLRSPVVGLSADSIVLLANQLPVVEALEAFEAPSEEDRVKLTRFLDWFLPLKGFADRLSAWEGLSEIFGRSGYLPALAARYSKDQLLANVRKLLTLAAEEPELGPLEYAERIEAIQELRHREGDAPSAADDDNFITIMTVHKAKGLEFPVVVLPETHRRLGSSDQRILVDADQGLVSPKFRQISSLFHRFLAERKNSQDVAEELRVLYVGLTRAKRRLCIAIYPASSHDTVSKKLRAVHSGRLNGALKVRSAPTKAS